MNNTSLLDALSNRRQFVLYRQVFRPDTGKLDKIPCDPLTGYDINAQDPANWLLPHEALMWSLQWGEGYGVGIVIYKGCGIFFIDLDHCRDASGGWQPYVLAFLARFPGAYFEGSVSRTGGHIFGTYTGELPDHRTRNAEFRMETYTEARFGALTGESVVGSVLADCTTQLHQWLAEYFPPREDAEHGAEWTDEPVAQWRGPEDDDALVERALRSNSLKAAFGKGAGFIHLWTADADVLAHAFPPQSAGQTWDGSAADLALANHLAFWTGNNCERIERMMRESQLVRPKWDRPDYLRNTILRACGSQREWYTEREQSEPAAPPSSGTPPTVTMPTPDTVTGLAVTIPSPPPPAAVPPVPPTTKKQLGLNELPDPGSVVFINMQLRLFAGMVYVEDIHGVQLPSGETTDKARFDAMYGGVLYQMTADNQRPSKSAWDCFIGSEVHRFPKVNAQFFDPRQPPALIETHEGKTRVNSYVPLDIEKHEGDVSPFVNHVLKLLPHGNDAQLLVYYMAAVVQYPGVKFQWCPMLQGVEGNGKTLLSKLLEYAVGERYTHWPKAEKIGAKFNAPFYGKVLICVEDVFIPEAKGQMWESIKPMITGTKLEIEPKGVDQVTRGVCFNFMLNTNHKDGIRKTRNDRRILPLFCAQQLSEHLERDGLTKDYFNVFRAWCEGEGRPIVADYLSRLPIPDELNPATACIRPPNSTSTEEAIQAGYGVAEQEIMEAIEIGAAGFSGGWIASTALDQLLGRIGKERAIPRRQRRELLFSLGYVPHPALDDGRLTVKLTDGTQPRLYIKRGHPWEVTHVNAAQIRDAYVAAQPSR